MGQATKQEKNIILEAWVERDAGCLSTQWRSWIEGAWGAALWGYSIWKCHPSNWKSWVQFEAKLLSFETLNRNLRMYFLQETKHMLKVQGGFYPPGSNLIPICTCWIWVWVCFILGFEGETQIVPKQWHNLISAL